MATGRAGSFRSPFFIAGAESCIEARTRTICPVLGSAGATDVHPEYQLRGGFDAIVVWRQWFMAAAAVVDRPDTGSDWARRYPPLISVAVALLIALAVLPSALNLPQSNPSTTLEFAPVPPEDDTPPPPQGNLGGLGLGSSTGLEQAGALGGNGGSGGTPEGLPPAAEAPGGEGKSNSTKRCVGHPDGKTRQTEDPLSPPCSADFQGDNFGATYQGVTGDQAIVLIYVQGDTRYVNICRDPNQITPNGQYFDLGKEPQEGEHCIVRVLRVWQRHFNDRYQTYKRYVRFIVYFSGRGDSAEERKADAADNYNQVKPFAVISYGSTFADDYLTSMAKRGVLNFGSFAARENSFFQKFPKLIWGYLPSLEIQADIFANWVCKQAGPKLPTSSSKNTGDNGKPRKYAYWASKDRGRPELIKLAALVKTKIKDICGIELAAEHYFPYVGYAQDNRSPGREAQAAVSDMQNKSVTTVIWPGGLETNFTKQAAAIAYRPEIIALGDGTLDTDANATFQEQSVWDGAKIATQATRLDDQRQSICYKAYREADPDGDDAEIRASGCSFYNDLRQLFTGIQVAGPRLGPTSIDKGFRAIPKIKSTNPEIPACFYEPGDYTCVKDAMVEHWDRAAENGQGCYRMREGGQRYFADIWPEEDVAKAEKPDDACNTYGTTFLVNPAPPSRNDL
jgi:hypothetical protein